MRGTCAGGLLRNVRFKEARAPYDGAPMAHVRPTAKASATWEHIVKICLESTLTICGCFIVAGASVELVPACSDVLDA